MINQVVFLRLFGLSTRIFNQHILQNQNVLPGYLRNLEGRRNKPAETGSITDRTQMQLEKNTQSRHHLRA